MRTEIAPRQQKHGLVGGQSRRCRYRSGLLAVAFRSLVAPLLIALVGSGAVVDVHAAVRNDAREARIAKRLAAQASVVSQPAPAPYVEGSLVMQPPRLRYCGSRVESTTVQLSWHTRGSVEKVQIFLQSPQGQLFLEGGPEGTESTGPWVNDGMQFVLFDPARGQELDRKTFRLLPCNTAEHPFEP